MIEILLIAILAIVAAHLALDVVVRVAASTRVRHWAHQRRRKRRQKRIRGD